MEPTILYEDQHLLVCYKPSGVPTQTAKLGMADMVSLLKNYLYKKEKKEPYLAVIHRLDQPVEGILVFAKTPFAAGELNRGLKTNCFGKYYKAVLCGVPKEQKGRLEDYMVKDARTNTSSICAETVTNAKRAVLFYEVLQTAVSNGEEQSLVQIRLETGRHHQIRVQMANLGCPILGDIKYNPFAKKEKGWQKIALCAYHLEFVHPKTKELMTFETELLGEGFQIFQ